MADEKLRYMVCCVNGAGSAQMMKMSLEKVLNKLGVEAAAVHHCTLSEGKSSAAEYDVVFCAQNFTNLFSDAEKKGTKVIGLRNIMSVDEMEQRLRENGIA